MHHRAEFGDVHIAARDTGINELIAIGVPEVQPPAAAQAKKPAPPIRAERAEKLFSDRIAARTDTGPNRGDQICWRGTEFAGHRIDSSGCDTRSGSAPPGMDGTGSAASRVEQ